MSDLTQGGIIIGVAVPAVLIRAGAKIGIIHLISQIVLSLERIHSGDDLLVFECLQGRAQVAALVDAAIDAALVVTTVRVGKEDGLILRFHGLTKAGDASTGAGGDDVEPVGAECIGAGLERCGGGANDEIEDTGELFRRCIPCVAGIAGVEGDGRDEVTCCAFWRRKALHGDFWSSEGVGVEVDVHRPDKSSWRVCS